MPFCTKCGKQNSDTASFCTSCGTALKKPANITEQKVVQIPALSTQPADVQEVLQESKPRKPLSGKSKLMLTGALVLAASFITVYYFFLRVDPARDGKKAAAAFCDCGIKQNEQLKDAYEKFISEFDTYKFHGKDDAQKKLNNLQELIIDVTKKCNAESQQMLTRLKERNVLEKEKMEAFEMAYTQQVVLCNNNDDKVGTLYNDAIKKINQYTGAAEKEQSGPGSRVEADVQMKPSGSPGKQDSTSVVKPQEKIVAAQAIEDVAKPDEAQSQKLSTSLQFAENNPPTVQRMKQDILGKTFKLPANEMGWATASYNLDVPFITFNSSQNSFQKESHLFTSSIDMITGYEKKPHYNLTGNISYTWDINMNAWYFKNLTVQGFKEIKEPQTATATTIPDKTVTPAVPKKEPNPPGELNKILFSSYRNGMVKDYAVGKATIFADRKSGIVQRANTIIMFINRDNEISYQNELIQHIQNWIKEKIKLSGINAQTIRSDSLFKIELGFAERFTQSASTFGSGTVWSAELMTSIIITKNGDQLKKDSFRNSTPILGEKRDKWIALEDAIIKCEKKLGKILDDYMQIN